MAHRDQLADHGAPLLFVEIGADAEHGQLVVAELRDLLGHAADQHVDQVHGAEALPGAIGAGQQLSARRPCRPKLRRRQAVVAVAARLRRDVLAEVAEQARCAGSRAVSHSAEQRVELAARHALERVAGRRTRRSCGAAARRPAGRRPSRPRRACRRARRGRSPGSSPRSLFGRSRWATKRTSGLSMPMPNAMVATITTPSSLQEAVLVARRARLRRGRRGRAAPAMPCSVRHCRGLLDLARATGSRRCRRRRRARSR